ncbi:hypothetical protein DH2020_001619 [Rehmannia glutinosa]|uniref:Retrotransposon Copia-like N-terminal domain-containing protein n=1 Tax=Rehmannia glutinosa TaxID=99300 RepID=A0ABR0XZV8_REHGL
MDEQEEEELQVANQVVAKEDDPLQLHGSEHPGMVLVSNQLTGHNYLPWRRSMVIALGAKTKLGFINGKIAVPAETSPKYDMWKKADCMVISWILNSISRDIVDAFIYANSAKELWDDLAQRFGECNGPQLFHLQKEIANVSKIPLLPFLWFPQLSMFLPQLICLSPHSHIFLLHP